MCRLFVENQLCCQSEGLLTSATYANVRVLCNQPVTLTPECLSIDGPTNFTMLDVLNANTSYSHQYLINYQESDYYGHVNVDLQRQRYAGQVSVATYLYGNCKGVQTRSACYSELQRVAGSTAMHCSELFRCSDNGHECHHTLYYLK